LLIYLATTQTRTNKLAPYGTGGRLLLPTPLNGHKTQDKIQKSGPDKLYVLCPNLIIWSFASPHYKWGGGVSDFQGLVTLTLDRVVLHTVMHQSLTSTNIPNFIEMEETVCVRLLTANFKVVTQKTRTKIKNPAPISFK